MSIDDIVTEVLIDTVKYHSEVWDVNNPLYRDKFKRDAAWKAIAGELVEDFALKDMRERKEIVRKIVNKWRNVKDAFVKSQKRRMEYGSTSKTSKYIYSTNLSFLLPSLHLVSSNSSMQEESNGVDDENSEDSTKGLPQTRERETISSTQCSSRAISTFRQIKRERESSPLKVVAQPFVVDPPDEDRAFFDSLLPTVKSFTNDQKLEFRVEVLNLARRIKQEGAFIIP